MQSLRHLYALLVLAAVAAGLTVTSSSVQAKPTVKTVTDTFAVTYDAKVTFKHHKAHPEFLEENDARYQVHGRLPEVTFVDGLLQTAQSAVVKTKAKGFAGVEVKQADDWSLNCVGTVFRVRGLAGLARTSDGISFLPALSAEPKGHCIDSEGAMPPFPFYLPWPGEGAGGIDQKTEGSVTFPVTAKSIDVPNWSKPFRIVFEDERCPNYEAELSILCSFVMKGKLTLTRVDREERVNGEVLLPALDPPRLNPKRNKVTPLHKKQVHLRAGDPTTITMPVTAADRAAAKQGLLVMTLQAKGGKRQVYPLV
jgi:hypothetical protein